MIEETEAFTVDPIRRDVYADWSGVYVRAKDGDKFGSFDAAQLDLPSLERWLRSRGGQNEWAENFIYILMGHEKIQ